MCKLTTQTSGEEHGQLELDEVGAAGSQVDCYRKVLKLSHRL